jgi:N-acetylmuramate 1-kinase
MTHRADLSAGFVAAHGWGRAQRRFLAGDASPRSYDRLVLGDKTAVLMDAPPDRGEDVRPFMVMAQHLRGLGLSAPDVLASDADTGFLLLEDLGDDLFARLLERAPQDEPALYAAATGVLAHLQSAPPPPGLPDHAPGFMAQAAGLSVTWYRRAITDLDTDPAPLVSAMAEAMARHCTARPVLVLRDYHAENLLWLPGRAGLARVGLLDFQMGSLGQPCYDLVSLLQDARRDVSVGLEHPMQALFADQTGTPLAAIETACAVLGAQRALRILGGFTRLSLHFGKPGYVRLIPRVWAHLWRNLDHPALAEVRAQAQAMLPPPTPQSLRLIEDKCGTIPNL